MPLDQAGIMEIFSNFYQLHHDSSNWVRFESFNSSIIFVGS